VTKVDHVIKKLDLAAIAERTDLPLRTLRYALDHDLVEGLRASRAGRGSARLLSLFDATVLTCAAALLEAGHSRARVRDMLKQYGGAKRTSQLGSFWQGHQRDRFFKHRKYFGSSFVQTTLHVGVIYLLLKGSE